MPIVIGWDYGDRIPLREDAVRWFEEGTMTAAYLYDGGGNRVKKVVRKSSTLKEVTVYTFDRASSPSAYQLSAGIDGGFEYLYNISGSSIVQEVNEIHVMDGRSRVARVREHVSGTWSGTAPEPVLYNLEEEACRSSFLGNSSFTLIYNGGDHFREEYFPFGESSFGSFDKKRYRFCGKERENAPNRLALESGLYYYGARYYAPWSCRFTHICFFFKGVRECFAFVSIDPLAGKYPFYSPYQYAGNQCINTIDLDGLEPPPGGAPGGQKASTSNDIGAGTKSNPSAPVNMFLSGSITDDLLRGKKIEPSGTYLPSNSIGSNIDDSPNAKAPSSASASSGDSPGVMSWIGDKALYFAKHPGPFFYFLDIGIGFFNSAKSGSAAPAINSLIDSPYGGIPGTLCKVGVAGEAVISRNDWQPAKGLVIECAINGGVALLTAGALRLKANVTFSGEEFGEAFEIAGREFSKEMNQEVSDQFVSIVYRNFGLNEYAALRQNKNQFHMGDNFQAKQFWMDEAGLNWWNSTDFSKNISAKIVVNDIALQYGYRFEDVGIHSVISFDSPEALAIFNKHMKILWLEYK